MALEDLTGPSKFIDALVAANPGSADDRREGDDHIRGVKNVLKNTFPNINAAVTLTDEQLNLAMQRSGDTMTGPLILPAGVAGAAPTRVPHGVAPTTPVNGDLWTTTAGLFARINGVTVGPFAASSGGIGFRATRTTLYTAASGDVVFDSDSVTANAEYDSNSAYNTATGRYIVPVAGSWTFNFWGTGGNVTGGITLRVTRAGSPLLDFAAGASPRSLTVHLNCAVNDEIHILGAGNVTALNNFASFSGFKN